MNILQAIQYLCNNDVKMVQWVEEKATMLQDAEDSLQNIEQWMKHANIPNFAMERRRPEFLIPPSYNTAIKQTVLINDR